MAALAWLLIPVIAAVAAGLWGSWAGRRRTSTPDAAGVAGYERFRAAMERAGTEAAEAPTEDVHEASVAHAEAVPAGAAPARSRTVARAVAQGPGRTGG